MGFGVSIGNISYAFEVNSMNDALKSLVIYYEISNDWKSVIEGLLTSSVYLGAFIGTFLSLFLVNRSLRKGIILLDLLMVTGAFI